MCRNNCTPIFMSTPYTYLIGWKALDLWYYGVKFSKTADPQKFWVNYFTSSKDVKALREEFGEPDVREIRRTFATQEAAVDWERKVIRRINAVWADKWINRGNGGHEFNPAPEKRARSLTCRQKISAARQRWLAIPGNREKQAEQSRLAGITGAEKIGAKARERFNDAEWKAMYVATHNTEEYLRAASIRTKELFEDPEYRAKHSAAMQDPEYRAKQKADSLARYATQESRDAHSAILKSALASPEARAKKSEAARASTAKRLETRRRNALAKAQSL